MNTAYVQDVLRFGSSKPYTNEDGKRFNLSHDYDFSPDLVQTDGLGGVVDMPLLWRKLCFGRPERLIRASVGKIPWTDDEGNLRLGKTPCDSCEELSPGVFQGCHKVVFERIDSNPTIRARMDEWAEICGTDVGPRCFIYKRSSKWHAFLNSIINHGGWANVNDDQVKLEALRLKKEQADRRRINSRARLQRTKAAYLGKAKPLRHDYLDALQTERDRRATHLKNLRDRLGRTPRDMLWLKMLPDESCDRIADVCARKFIKSVPRRAARSTQGSRVRGDLRREAHRNQHCWPHRTGTCAVVRPQGRHFGSDTSGSPRQICR